MEDKTYEFKGTVTISTEEYRDLVRSSIENEKDAAEYRHKFWSEQDVTKKLNTTVATKQAQIDNFIKFLEEKGLKKEYSVWLVDKENDEE